MASAAVVPPAGVDGAAAPGAPVVPAGQEAEAETIFKVMSNQVRDSQLYTA